MNSRTISFLAAAIILLASGITCHLLAGDSEQLDAAAARVADVPRVVGDWRGRDEEVDEAAFAMAGAKSYWTRSYVNERTKDAVLVILMCGRPGRMAVHTPEVCYGGAGYELREEPSVVDVKDLAGSQWWHAIFSKKTTAPQRLRLFWAWNSQGNWHASAAPRWQFRGEPFLYKLYVSRDTTKQPALSPQADPALDFLRVFVPALQRSLFPEN
jgi:hypothetical protein